MKVKVPTHWKEVSLKQYMEIADILAVDLDLIDRHVQILSVLTGHSQEQILSLPVGDLKKAIQAIQFIYKLPKYSGVRSSLKIKGNRFVINKDVKKLTGGEYITFTSLIKDKEQITKNLPDIISLFLHPVNFFLFKKKKRYKDGCQTIESHEQTATLIRDHLNMDVVFEMSGFFLKSYDASTKATLNYSIKMNRKNLKWLQREMKGS